MRFVYVDKISKTKNQKKTWNIFAQKFSFLSKEALNEPLKTSFLETGTFFEIFLMSKRKNGKKWQKLVKPYLTLTWMGCLIL